MGSWEKVVLISLRQNDDNVTYTVEWISASKVYDTMPSRQRNARPDFDI